MTTSTIPGPDVNDPIAKEFYAAAATGKFLVRKCTACTRAHWYPRAVCPFCFSDKTEWAEGSGKARIYSHSTMASKADPFTIAYVTLAEGPTMLTHIVDAGEVHIGMDVALTFRQADNGVAIPMFAPVK